MKKEQIKPAYAAGSLSLSLARSLSLSLAPVICFLARRRIAGGAANAGQCSSPSFA